MLAGTKTEQSTGRLNPTCLSKQRFNFKVSQNPRLYMFQSPRRAICALAIALFQYQKKERHTQV